MTSKSVLVTVIRGILRRSYYGGIITGAYGLLCRPVQPFPRPTVHPTARPTVGPSDCLTGRPIVHPTVYG